MTRSPALPALRGFWLACAFSLAACGGGGGPGTSTDVTLQPPVTNTATFGTRSGSPFVVGTPPFGAQFTGGAADGGGSWVIPDGQTGTVDFTTPADRVVLNTVANVPVAARGTTGQAKTRGAAPSQAVNAPFTVPMYVRGSVRGDWAAAPENLLAEEADNVLSVSMPLEAGDYQFKVADGGWTGATNCGADTDPTPVAVGVPFTMQCDALSQNLLLTIATAGNYKFTFNVSNASAPTILVARVVPGGGGGGGGEEPPPAGVKVRLFDRNGSQIKELESASGVIAVDESRRGGESRIARIEVENVGGVQGIGVPELRWTADPRFSPQAVSTSIYYRSPTGNYANTTIRVGNQTYACTPDGSFGCRATGIPFLPYTELTYTVTSGGTTETITAYPGDGSQSLYTFAGSGSARLGAPAALPAGPNEVVLYYLRPDGNYTGWGLHLFPVQPATGDWTVFTGGEYFSQGVDPVYGAYFRIRLPQNASPPYSNDPASLATFPEVLGLIIHKGDLKDPGPDQFIRIAEGNVVFVVSGVNDVSTVPPGSSQLRISGASAHWVNASTLLWTPPAGVTQVRLLASMDASIKAGVQGLDGAFDSYTLTSTSRPALDNQRHLSTLGAWALPAAAVAEARELARQQLVVIGLNADGEAVAGTLVQTAGALDALYADAAYGEPLGVSFSGSAPTLRVWAPTALTDPGVSVRVYETDGSLIEERAMTLDEDTGIWSVTGPASWNRKFYRIRLDVYTYATDAIVTNEVTDPYSLSLSADSVHSQFVNLDDADLKPAGWDTLVKPALDAPEDIVVYELHVRDFSIADTTVPAGDRGKYTAFDVPGTAGRQHLEALADAGLTHVHLLPAFDIATVREKRADRVEIDDPVEALCAANPAAAPLCQSDAGKTIRRAMQDAVANGQLERPQQIVGWIRNLDGFNWGYDPLHFGAPEGSYATDPNGTQRILEFRRMVQGLADAGLGTIMDVVYNHTNASGQSPRSVLDRLVPGYYHRRDAATGNVLRDSCCDDTASEFRMMEKLMLDTGVTWVRDYKVDGFRFDLMSFHPKGVMERFQTAVKAVNPDVYVYGEGWNFGAIQNDRRFLSARQANLAGTGIGSFSDRIRDPVRGGGPFDSGANHVANQGFISGWYYDPNSVNSGGAAEREALIEDTDNIRVWLAGGLRNYRFTSASGAVVAGSAVDYRGQQSGYTLDPQEAMNYISKHDNETLWDISQYKHPVNTPTAERVRAHNVGLSVVLLGQGIPFLHAGSDILRSKSMDRNSFDSGDWFNEIDWSLATTKWNVGLPPQGDNQASWPQITETVFNVNARPGLADRQAARAHVREMLRIRKSSPLFRLRTGAEVEKRVSFENTGPFQVPGVVAMRIDGCADPSGLSPPEGAVMVVINASDDPRTLERYTGETWTLHPVLAASADPVVRTARHDANGFFVPARTTAVFRRAAQNSCAPYPREIFVRGVNGDWSANPARLLAFQGGVDYSATFPLSAGAQDFKIADQNWTGDTNCGAPNGGLALRLGVPAALACFNNSGNVALQAPAAGDYTFDLDASDTANPVLTVSRTPFTPLPLYVRGVTGDWSANPARQLAWDGVSRFQVVIGGLPANAPQDFKIADADWGGSNGGATNCGAGANGTVTVGQPYTLNCNNSSGNLSVTLPTAGSYLFSVDASNPAAPALTVEKTPFDVALFLRGLDNDWSDGAQNRLRYVGNRVYRTSKILAAGADDFKIADSDWGGTTGGATNCGAANPVVIGQPLAIDCSSNSPNVNFTAPAAGSYVFELTVPQSGAPSLVVSGP